MVKRLPRNCMAAWDTRMRAALGAGAHSFRILGDLERLVRTGRMKNPSSTKRDMRNSSKRFPLVTLCQYDVRQCSSVAIVNTLKLHRDNFRYPEDRVLG